MIRGFCRAALAAVVTTIAAAAASAQGYPTKNIVFVVASAAGGPADVSARLVADRMSQSLGQQIIIEAVPGAGGTIGMARVARANPDGYTLLVHQVGFAITPSIYDKLNFDTAKDFATVGLLNQSFVYLVGRADLPPNTFAELVAWMKGPGKPIKYAHPGTGSLGQLQTLMLVRALGVDASLVAYRGIAPAVNDLLGGHVDIANVGAAVATPQIKAGKLKVYASGAPRRAAALPDVPTFGEVGHKELEKPFWHALFAPAATPRPVLERLNAAIADALRDPQVQKAYAASGVEPYPEAMWSIDAAGKYVQDEIAFWGKVVRDNNVKAEP